jgi:hypothetical protein
MLQARSLTLRALLGMTEHQPRRLARRQRSDARIPDWRRGRQRSPRARRHAGSLAKLPNVAQHSRAFPAIALLLDFLPELGPGPILCISLNSARRFTRRLPPGSHEGCHPGTSPQESERSDACPKFLVLVLLGLGSGCQFVRAFAHGVSFQGNFIGVMDEAI